MSEYIKSDIGEFLTSRTMNFEKSPPDFIWENVEKNIPVYKPSGTVSTMVKLVIGTMSLSVMIFAILWIKHQSFTKAESLSGFAVNQKSATFIQQMEVLPRTSEQISGQSEEQISTKNNTIQVSKNNQVTEKVNTPTSNKTYSINASGLKGVTEISFIDEKNKVILSEKKPQPNSFGFFVIDISKLPVGSYSIMITTNEGTKLHKKETFN